MAVVAQVVSAVVEPVVQVVGKVEEVVVQAAEQVGHAVEQVGQQIGKTAEAIAQDPTKAIALVAVAVVAPELAPLLWEGATTAEAAMLLNAGVSVAQGVPPEQIVANLATSTITQGITQGMDISTGNALADKLVGQTASGVIQGKDVGTALGSSIANTAIGAGVGATAGGVRGLDFSSDTSTAETAPAQSYSDLSKDMTAEVPQDNVSASEVFKDAVDSGFSPQEAYAIAQGQNDAENPQEAYAPTASTITSDQPEATVQVSAAPSELGAEPPAATTEEPTGALDQLAAEEPTAEEPTAEEPTGALDQLTAEEPTVEEAAIPEPKDIVSDGLLGQTTDENGNIVNTYDDGSTLTLSPDNEVIDYTEATDTGEVPAEEVPAEEQAPATEEKTGTGSNIKLSLAFPLGSTSGTKQTSTKKPTTSGGATTTGGLDTISLNAQYGSPLTAGIATGNPEYSLLGETEKDDVQMFGAGGSATQDASSIQGVTDLSYTANSPFSSDTKIMALKPNVVKGKIDYALPGYPFGKEWHLAKNGGHMVEDDHKPEFFSEGGLGSLKNRYVKGAGDGTSDSIKAMLADGEFVIPADVVSSLGNGSNDSGAKVLDEFLRTIRAHKRKADPKKLPPDSKGALGYLLEAKKRVKK